MKKDTIRMHGSPFLVIINKTLKFEGDSRMIKAIMCDVDGTLLNSQGVVSPYTIEQIKKVKAQGESMGWSMRLLESAERK